MVDSGSRCGSTSTSFAVSVAKRPPKRRVRWASSYRVINARFPPIGLFERIADPWRLGKFDSSSRLLTNPRLRQEAGEISLVPTGGARGWGGGFMGHGAFHTHRLAIAIQRWEVGVSNTCAWSLVTAVHEKAHHIGLFFARTRRTPGHHDGAACARCYESMQAFTTFGDGFA